MKWKEALVSLAAVGVIMGVGFWAYRSVTRPARDLCQVCNRGLHAGVTYRLELAGAQEDACCPRCGMHYEIEHPGAVKQAWATDLPTGQLVAAQSAYYVEGGDVEYCTMHSTPVEREPQGVRVRGYDRCLPSLVAFRTHSEAATYQAQHGGQVLTYQQAVERVKAL